MNRKLAVAASASFVFGISAQALGQYGSPIDPFAGIGALSSNVFGVCMSNSFVVADFRNELNQRRAIVKNLMTGVVYYPIPLGTGGDAVINAISPTGLFVGYSSGQGGAIYNDIAATTTFGNPMAPLPQPMLLGSANAVNSNN